MADKITAAIAEINERLDALEQTTLWLIRPTGRFKVNQRVRLSEYADRHRIKFNKGVRTGKVTEVAPFGWIKVLVDGQAKPREFFHGFWEPARRS